MEYLIQTHTLFFLNLLTGLVFTFLGLITWKNPPKKINDIYGYRTSQSMSSQEKWDFAQVYSSKLMFLAGLLMIVIGLFDYIAPPISTGLAVGLHVFILIFSCIVLILLTEKKLKQIKN